jgi:hypothetical protein
MVLARQRAALARHVLACRRLLFMPFWKGWLAVVKPPAAVAVKR